MEQHDLINAFNDCVDRLQAGQSVGDCLHAHPQHAVSLRSMLEAVLAIERAAPAVPRAARARVRRQVLRAADQLPSRRAAPQPGWTLRALMGAAAALVVVLVAGLITLNQDDSTKPPAVVNPSPTLTGTATSEPATVTLTPSVSPTDTPAPPSQTATGTLTPALTSTPSQTPSPSPSPSPSPTPTLTGTPTLTSTPSRTPERCVRIRLPGWIDYVVRAGDTLESIARAWDTTPETLRRVNCLSAARALQVGQVLYVPGEDAATNTPTPASGPGGVSPTQSGGGQLVPTSPPPFVPTPDDDSPDDDDGDDDGGDSSGSDDDGDDDNSGPGGGSDDDDSRDDDDD